MAIHFFEEEIKRPKLKYRLISTWIKRIIALNQKSPGEINYIFCTNSYLLNINQQFLQHNYFTDIITFDYVENDIISGDIFISCEMVQENSSKFSVNLEDEYLRVISHGILHLLGYKDKTNEEKQLMRQKETESIILYKEI
jgi:rRNA maturation RNase YbeY